jgi:exosortase
MTVNGVSWRFVVPSILVLAALFYCYWDVLTILVTQWSTNDAYSHGFLIPAISLGIVWQSRHRLAKLQSRGSLVAGAAVLAAGLSILLLGRAIDIVGIQQLSLLPSLGGVALLLGGREALRLLWFPIGYLVFMMPVWDVVTERLHYPFQQFSAYIGGSLLQTVGIPVLQQDTYLQLPNVTLEVARVCSGVNYLVAVAAIGVPLAYLTFPDWLRRCLLVAFGLAIAILANPVRVALIGVFSHFGLSPDLHGPGHVFQGLFVAGIGYVALLCGVAVLRRWGYRPAGTWDLGTSEKDAAAETFAPAPPGLEAVGHSVGAGLAIALLLAASALAPSSLSAESDTAPWLAGLPASIGTWQRVKAVGINERPGNASRIYRNPSGQRVEVRFAPVIPNYGTSTPDWSDRITLQATPVFLDLSGDEVVTINRAHDGGGMRRIPVLYWYDVNGRVSSDRIAAKVHTMWHRFTGHGRLPVAVFVRPTTHGSSDEDVIDAATTFARDLVTALRRPLRPQVHAGTPKNPGESRTAPSQP